MHTRVHRSMSPWMRLKKMRECQLLGKVEVRFVKYKRVTSEYDGTI
jgi:hypothetical protein